ncbi:MAG: DUF2207 domain-containing protein [Acetanaerobacterium sp.]
MKKRLILRLTIMLLLCLVLQVAAAAVNRVSDIGVEVVLCEDGSAYITQTWNCDFAEGTEAYFPLENLGDMTLSDFSVSDINGAYTYLDDWNLDASFDEKAGKCGIVETDRGYELCWGLTDYGQTRYAIEYKLDGLVGAYEDYDGFNFQFVGSGMGTLPTDATVKIVTQNGTALTSENCGIWAFGFDGQINFEDDQIVACTETPLTDDTDSVIVMVQLNKDVLSPARMADGSFAQVKSRAFEGSDYDNTDTDTDTEDSDQRELGLFGEILSTIFGIFMALLFLSPIIIVGFVVFRFIKKKREFKKLYNDADYFREAPIAGNLEAVMALAGRFKQSNDDGNLIAAAFLKLINTGNLEPIMEKSIGMFGKEKECISLRLVTPPKFTGVCTRLLYELLMSASGPDGVLQEKELERYCSSNYAAMIELVECAKKDGESTLAQINCYNGKPSANPKCLTARGKGLLLQIIGFKKYLLDFSLIDERGISESIIWQDYLVFAALLGIADKAMAQFKQVYPTVTPYQEHAQHYYYLAYQYQRASYRAAVSANAARSSGSGGNSSFGGGGGFSGGGSGGGTR